MKYFFTVLSLLFVMGFFGEARADVCLSRLKDHTGKTLQTFTGTGYLRSEACLDAKARCESELRARHLRRMNPRAVCVIDSSSFPRHGRRIVTKSCQADLVSVLRHVVASFQGVATGIEGTNVKARACSQAINKCENFKVQSGRIAATCHINNLVYPL